MDFRWLIWSYSCITTTAISTILPAANLLQFKIIFLIGMHHICSILVFVRVPTAVNCIDNAKSSCLIVRCGGLIRNRLLSENNEQCLNSRLEQCLVAWPAALAVSIVLLCVASILIPKIKPYNFRKFFG